MRKANLVKLSGDVASVTGFSVDNEAVHCRIYGWFTEAEEIRLHTVNDDRIWRGLFIYMSTSMPRLNAHSHCTIATATLLVTTNGLYRIQGKCSYCMTTTTSPTPMQPIISKNKAQSQIAQCEWTLKATVRELRCVYADWLTLRSIVLPFVDRIPGSSYRGTKREFPNRCFWISAEN